MKVMHSLVLLSCALWEANGYPYNYYSGYGNMDSLSYGSSDSSRGGMVMSRYYNPYYQRAVSGGMASFMYRPEEQAVPQSGQYYYPDRRRQTTLENYVPPQQNEVIPQNEAPQQNDYFPQQPEISPLSPTEATEIADPTEKTEASTTFKAVLPELIEPEVKEVEEPAPKPKKAVSRKKPVKKPVIDEDDDEESFTRKVELIEPEVEEVEEPAPKPKKAVSRKKPVIDEDDDEESFTRKVPASAFFPMFFYGGRSSGGPGGPTAIANAYSTGRGGVATSHATAYGEPRPEQQRYKSH